MNPTSSRHSSADASSCISSHETESEWWIDADNDAPDDSDSASSSAGDSPDAPRMRQRDSDKDVMQIDSDDESDRRDLKRKWVDTVEQGASSADADFPHSITGFSATESEQNRSKRARIDAPRQASSPQPRQPAMPGPSLLCKVLRDADLIQLIRRHGGSETGNRREIEIELRLPEKPSLEFRFAYFCLLQQKLDRGIDFPGKPEFRTQAFTLFAGCLDDACRANEAGLVSRLLDTGHPASSELIAQLLAASIASGAQAAAEVLLDAEHTPSGTCWAEEVTNIEINWPELQQNLPPTDWQAQVRTDFTVDDLDEILRCLSAGGNQETGLSKLFGGADRRPSGQFVIRLSKQYTQAIKQALLGCGAVTIGKSRSYGRIFLHAGDFDHEQLKQTLLRLHGDAGLGASEALSFAVTWGDLDIVRALLDAGARPEVADHDDRNALHHAADAGHVPVVKLLIQNLLARDQLARAGQQAQAAPPISALTAALRAIDGDGYSPLYLAASSGSYHLCASLLNQGALPTTPGQSPDPILIAAEHGHSAICSLLAISGADINVRDNDGLTPFLLAAKHRHSGTCKTLAKYGADVTARDDEANSAMVWAIKNEDLELVDFLLRQGVSVKEEDEVRALLPFTANHDNPALLQLLLDQGASIDNRAQNGKTALMKACSVQNPVIVEFLLRKGANPDLVNVQKKSMSALLYASGNAKIIELLLSHGSMLHLGMYGYLALVRAIASGAEDTVRLLLQHHTPTDGLSLGFTNFGRSLLLEIDFSIVAQQDETKDVSVARIERNIRILKMLIDHKVPLHLTNEDGNDALMMACEQGNNIAVDVLVKHGARIGQINRSGKNALAIAMDKLAIALSNSEPILGADIVLIELLKQMHRQVDMEVLRQDALHIASHSVVRDMLLISWVWSNPPTGPSTLWFPVDVNMLVGLSNFLTTRLCLPKLSQLPQLPTWERQLSEQGMPQPIIDLMMPTINAAPLVLPALTGGKLDMQAKIADSMVEGMFAGLTPELLPGWQERRMYEHYALAKETETTLSAALYYFIDSLTHHFQSQEEEQRGHIFANLFEICIQQTRQPMLIGGQLAALDSESGPLAAALISSGIYAPLATKIEDAWRHAWEMTAATAAGAADSHSSTTASASSASANTLSNDVFLPLEFDPEIDVYFNDGSIEANPTSFQVFDILAAETSAPGSADFIDTPLAAELLKTFRSLLRSGIDSPGSHILKLAERDTEVAPAQGAEQSEANKQAARDVYAQLMHRQLHLLSQFIDGQAT